MPKAVASKPAVPNVGEFLTVREAAAILKLSEISIRRFLTLRKLKRYKVGSRTLLNAVEVRALVREV
jgi:excisionase family DNA binding protein